MYQKLISGLVLSLLVFANSALATPIPKGPAPKALTPHISQQLEPEVSSSKPTTPTIDPDNLEPTFSKPDLIVEDVTIEAVSNGARHPDNGSTEYSFSVTDDLFLSVTIKNQGMTTVPEGCFDILFRDDASPLDWIKTFTYCGKASGENLLTPGKTATFQDILPYEERNIKLNRNNLHSVKVWVDSYDIVEESDESNNMEEFTVKFYTDPKIVIDDLKLSNETYHDKPVTLAWSDPNNLEYDRFEIKYFSDPVESDYNPYEIQYYTMYTESEMLYKVGYLDYENLKDLNSENDGWFTYTDGQYSKVETPNGIKNLFTLNNPFPLDHQTYVIRFIKNDGTSVYSNALYFFYEDKEGISPHSPKMTDFSSPGGPYALTWGSNLTDYFVPGHELDYEVRIYTSTATANPFEINYYTDVTESGLVYMVGDANQELTENLDRFTTIASGQMGADNKPPLYLGEGLRENTNYVFTISTTSRYSGLSGTMRVVEFDSGSEEGSYISRGELAKLLVESAGYEINTTGGSHFPDVPESSPYYEAVETLYNAGIFRADSSGSFRANDPVNRAEAAKLFVLTFDLRMVSPDIEVPYQDVDPRAWYFEWVRILYSNDALEGGLYFEPTELATVSFVTNVVELLDDTRRMIAADFLVDGFNMTLDVTGGPHFSDVPTTHGYYPEIETLYNAEIINKLGTYFLPEQNITKAEAAKLIVFTSKLPVITDMEEDDISECGLPYDVGANDWYTPYIMTLAYYGFDVVDENCNFYPQEGAQVPFFKEVVRTLGGSIL